MISKLIKTCLIALAMILVFEQIGSAQNPPPSGAGFRQAAPPEPDLVAVDHPDLRDLEPDVRSQIIEFQQKLLVSARDKNATATSLGEAYGAMGQIYHLYSQYQAAGQCYKNARSLEPNNFKWVYLLGKSRQQKGDLANALQIFLEALKIKSDYPALIVNLGDIYLEMNRLDEAEAEFRKTLDLDPGLAAAVYGLGQVELSRKNFTIAAVYFERVLQLVPSANRVYYSLGIAYRGQKDLEKARTALARQGSVGVRAADPLFEGLQELQQGVRLHLQRGKLAIDAGRFAEAAAEYQKAIAAEPENVPARVNLGAVLIQLDKAAEASEQFAEAVRLDPKNTNARFNLGMLLSLQHKYLEALIQFQAIVREDPKDFAARFQLAKQFLSLKRDDEALEEFAGIVRDKPDYENALIEQVTILLRKKRYPEVKEALEKSYAEFPQHGRTVALLARFLAASPRYYLRDGKRALELAQKVYQASGEVEHGVLVAMAYAELINCKEAARWQKSMIDKAINDGDKPGAEKLMPALKKYQTAFPCRP